MAVIRAARAITAWITSSTIFSLKSLSFFILHYLLSVYIITRKRVNVNRNIKRNQKKSKEILIATMLIGIFYLRKDDADDGRTAFEITGEDFC